MLDTRLAGFVSEINVLFISTALVLPTKALRHVNDPPPGRGRERRGGSKCDELLTNVDNISATTVEDYIRDRCHGFSSAN